MLLTVAVVCVVWLLTSLIFFFFFFGKQRGPGHFAELMENPDSFSWVRLKRMKVSQGLS